MDCNIDQYETSPTEGWFRWMVNQIEEADYVLVVCTENYEKRFKGKEEAGKGLGTKFEGAIITQQLYFSEANNKWIPIVFSLEDSKYIPSILKSATYYVLSKDEITDEESYYELYARLTDQKTIIKPDIGKLRHIIPFISKKEKERASIESNQKPMIGELRKINTMSQNSVIPRTFTSPSTGMEFVLVPAGEFMMGSEYSTEKPAHKVMISEPFYLGRYQVTQKQWKIVMDKNPSTFKGDYLPVEYVSWNDAQNFIKKLNENESTDKYRLPSEAEWEYACRAGSTTSYYFGDDESNLGNYAWYNKNSGKNTHTVGQRKSNSWGLYDMHGNVWEWVQDRWHNNYKGAPSDGNAWEDGKDSVRVFRGGGHRTGDGGCWSTTRNGNTLISRDDDVGFRVLRTL